MNTVPENVPNPLTDGDKQDDKRHLSTAELLPVVAVRDVVLFPGMVLPLAIGRPEAVAAVEAALKEDRPVGLLLQHDPATERPTPEDLHRIGTIANVLRFLTSPDGSRHLVCQGVARFRAETLEKKGDYLETFAARLDDPAGPVGTQLEAQLLHLRQQSLEALRLLPNTPEELVRAVQQIKRPGELADLVAGYLDLEPAEKQRILATTDLVSRLAEVSRQLERRLEVLRISERIQQETKEAMDKRQREFILREQLRQIQKELGEGDPKTEEQKRLAEAIANSGMPDPVRQQAESELGRLDHMSEASPEFSMVRTYLDWLVALPWAKETDDNLDLKSARQILDADHFGLDKIKTRIIEFLAVRKRSKKGKAPILCFVGPPGVGKTSLGQSIAKAMGRKFERISLGGIHDESEIRGHRRTYIGALPGNIIRSLRKSETRNPLIMLDELDKLGTGFQGDPAAALLEVLDPEQNTHFRDSYLDVEFDLSRVIFIGTANVIDQIPGPLRDRLEIIELSGYTRPEKLEIARRYLVQRQIENNGLSQGEIELPDSTLEAIIEGYTREAGVRQLERVIGAVARNVTTRIAEGQAGPYRIQSSQLEEILGPARYENEAALRTSVPGVATGLAWTPVGGQILFIEANLTPGTGRLRLTGQLGDVMKESAEIALSLIKSRAEEWGIDAKCFSERDLHLHVPAGGIPKDGPSAGITMSVAMVSLLSGRKVYPNVAMTGEITLRGLVLPVGGIKEKVIAAHAAGITRVVLPARNRRDFQDIPQAARDALEFTWVDTIDDVLEAALGEPAP